jgi:hypothetical protein
MDDPRKDLPVPDCLTSSQPATRLDEANLRLTALRASFEKEKTAREEADKMVLHLQGRIESIRRAVNGAHVS